MNKRKFIATLSLTAMLLNFAVVPAAATENAGIDLSVVGNGVQSDNDIDIDVDHDVDVKQENDTNIETTVNASSDTGSNSMNRNTGGSGLIDTGDATSEVVVSNAAGSNEAVVDCCGAQDIEVTVSGNGDSSDNKVDLRTDNDVDVKQENSTRIDNRVDNDANTGWNDANRNTGGDVTILTGNASAATAVLNAGNVNSAVVRGEGRGGSLSAWILGNGVDSDNDIWLKVDHDVDVDQENSVSIDNKVDTDAVSGKNEANRNTGGDVLVDTGDAEVAVLVDNAVNFNFADVDCGCLLDVNAKVAQNGDSSDNKIKASLEDDLDVDQENSCGKSHNYGFPEIFGGSLFGGYPFGGHESDCVDNDVYADAFSGWNDVNRNTGETGGDPTVATGDADTSVEVYNAGASNVYGDVSDWELPGDDQSGNGVNINISFDIEALLELLGRVS